MYCIRHIAANFLRRLKKRYLHRLVVSIGNLYFVCICASEFFFFHNISTTLCFAGYLRTEREFNHHYERMCQHGEIYTDWLDEIPREKWVQAFDRGHRYGHMTTNLVECMNFVLKGVHNLPITTLVRATYFRLVELFDTKGSDAYARKAIGYIFSKTLTTRLRENQQAAESMCHYYCKAT